MAIRADDAATGSAELRRIEERMHELERQPGRKTLEVETPREGAQGRSPVKAVAETLVYPARPGRTDGRRRFYRMHGMSVATTLVHVALAGYVLARFAGGLAI